MFLYENQLDALISLIYFCNKTLHVSDSSSVRHQEYAQQRYIPLLCVQWRTPDDGQRNCPKHVEFYSKNKFEKLVHLFGFIIRTHTFFSFSLFNAVWTCAVWNVRDSCYMLLVALSQDTNWSTVLRCRLALLRLDFLQFLAQSLRVYCDGCHAMCCNMSENWSKLQSWNNYPTTKCGLFFLEKKAWVQNGFFSSIKYVGSHITRKWFAES